MTAGDFSFEPVNKAQLEVSPVPVMEAIPSSTLAQETYNEDGEESPSDVAIMVGCGLAGCFVAGPFFAILTALGGKYAADRDDGPIGDSSRALGRIASAAGEKAEEERLLSKLGDAILSVFTKKNCDLKKCSNGRTGSKQLKTVCIRLGSETKGNNGQRMRATMELLSSDYVFLTRK